MYKFRLKDLWFPCTCGSKFKMDHTKGKSKSSKEPSIEMPLYLA
jgi:hypothetical protein